MDCFVSGPDITFVQIMGRNEQNKGKPLVVLDTHNGVLNVRFNNFKGDMIRTGLDTVDYTSPILVRLNCMISNTRGFFEFNIQNGKKPINFTRRDQTYFTNQTPKVILSFGAYMTDSFNTPRHTLVNKLVVRATPITDIEEKIPEKPDPKIERALQLTGQATRLLMELLDLLKSK
jgi:hypothetical protein